MKQFFEEILDLKATSDFERAKASISEGVSLRGYNLWILLCAALLASLGLDTNSTAVIIGAMLISPLMSPILGIGLSVAILDKRLLVRSLRNLIMAVIISLFASVLYFTLTPLGEVTPELQARTFPTLLDVLVALFGGIAGIISISRRDPTNAIPGVAIATALMPPLCTAGFGIATLRWNFFLGAFYLFFINAVFISLTTYLIAKYLHFPSKEFSNKELYKKYSRWFTIISIAALIPSIYFLYTVYQRETIKKTINNIVINRISSQGNEILKWEIDNRDTVSFIKVYHSGKPLSDSIKQAMANELVKKGIHNYKLIPHRINMTREEINELSEGVMRNMFHQMELERVKEKVDTTADTLSYTQFANEVKAAFPFIDTCINGWSSLPDSTGKIKNLPVFVYYTRRPINTRQVNQLYKYLVIRLSVDSAILVAREAEE